MEFQYNDGGRKETGYKGDTRDCVCRSISIVTGKPYKEIYETLENAIDCCENVGNMFESILIKNQ